MHKQKSSKRELFCSALTRVCSRVFFAILRHFFATPVIFYTRVCTRTHIRVHAREEQAHDNSSVRSRRRLLAPLHLDKFGLVAVFALALAISLSATLISPVAASTNNE